MQAIEIGHAVDAEQYGFAIDHKRAGTVAKGGLDDQGITVGPIVAVAREQPDLLAIRFLQDQPDSRHA
jgi:hypothetical protein